MAITPTQSHAGKSSGSYSGIEASAATVRLAPLARIPQLLRELGFAPEKVLGEAGFSVGWFDDPDQTMTYVAAGRLIDHCVTATGCDHFGLLLGAQSDPSVVGMAGFLLMTAPDVGTALRELSQFMDLHDRGGVLILETDDETCLLGFTVVESNVVAMAQIYDLCGAIACNIMRSLCGPDWRPTEVHLPRRRPADAGPWRRFFQMQVHFDAATCGLRFSKSWLSHCVPGANPVLHTFLQRQATELQSKRPVSFVDEVRHIVQNEIKHTSCNAAFIAQRLGLHERTLERRLHAQGTSFMNIQTEVLFRMSRQLLDDTSMKVCDIAMALNYADSSTFIRAFTRWSGLTPMRWRLSQDHRITQDDRQAGQSPDQGIFSS